VKFDNEHFAAVILPDDIKDHTLFLWQYSYNMLLCVADALLVKCSTVHSGICGQCWKQSE
jgi:hypothetical protein